MCVKPKYAKAARGDRASQTGDPGERHVDSTAARGTQKAARGRAARGSRKRPVEPGNRGTWTKKTARGHKKTARGSENRSLIESTR